jgi:hypothetical protein
VETAALQAEVRVDWVYSGPSVLIGNKVGAIFSGSTGDSLAPILKASLNDPLLGQDVELSNTSIAFGSYTDGSVLGDILLNGGNDQNVKYELVNSSDGYVDRKYEIRGNQLILVENGSLGESPYDEGYTGPRGIDRYYSQEVALGVRVIGASAVDYEQVQFTITDIPHYILDLL